MVVSRSFNDARRISIEEVNTHCRVEDDSSLMISDVQLLPVKPLSFSTEWSDTIIT
jgi:hypothetical protein